MIEAEAIAAAEKGLDRAGACSYPYGSDAEKHWTAVFLWNGGTA